MLKTMELPVRLTDEEVRLKGEGIARKLKDKELLEEKRKDVAKRFKEDIAELDVAIVKARDEVRERREMRDVQVEDLKDWDSKVVRTIRLDTGEVVASRPMTPGELQQHLSIIDDDGERVSVTFHAGIAAPDEEDVVQDDDDGLEDDDEAAAG